MVSDEQQVAFARLMTLNGNGPGAAITENLPGLVDKDSERMAAWGGAYSRYFAMSGPTDSGVASVAKGVGSAAPQFGSVESAAQGAGQDAPRSKSVVLDGIEGTKESVALAQAAATETRAAREDSFDDRRETAREAFDADAIAERARLIDSVARAIDGADVDGNMAIKEEVVSAMETFTRIPIPPDMPIIGPLAQDVPVPMIGTMPFSGSDRGREFESFRNEAEKLGLTDEAREAYAAADYLRAHSADLKPFVDSGRIVQFSGLDDSPLKAAYGVLGQYIKEHPDEAMTGLIALAGQRQLTAGERAMLVKGSGGDFKD